MEKTEIQQIADYLKDLGHVYDNVSLASNAFQRDRLKSLEENEH
jgi:hypothetical protein